MKKLKLYLIALILKRFAPDYESIKAENKILQRDIHTIVMKENSIAAVATTASYRMRFLFNNLYSFGNPIDASREFQGFCNKNNINQN